MLLRTDSRLFSSDSAEQIIHAKVAYPVITLVGACDVLLTHLPSVTLTFCSLLLVKGRQDALDLAWVDDTHLV